MSETLYTRISTQNIACSQCKMHTCILIYISFSYTLWAYRERKRDQVKQTDTVDLTNKTMQKDNDYIQPEILKRMSPTHLCKRKSQEDGIAGNWAICYCYNLCVHTNPHIYKLYMYIIYIWSLLRPVLFAYSIALYVHSNYKSMN